MCAIFCAGIVSRCLAAGSGAYDVGRQRPIFSIAIIHGRFDLLILGKRRRSISRLSAQFSEQSGQSAEYCGESTNCGDVNKVARVEHGFWLQIKAHWY
jgi:hypothetical protein